MLSQADDCFVDARQRSAALARAPAHECREFFRDRLRRLDERIDVDVIDSAHDERLVILNADGDRTATPLLDAIAQRACELSPLRVLAAMPPEPALRATQRVKSELGIDVADARARAGFARGHLLELVIYSAAFASSLDERALCAAELLVSSLVGDRVFDDWIGEVRVAPLPRKSLLPLLDDDRPEQRSFEVSSLAETVGAAVEGVLAGLPERALHEQRRESEAGWTMFELEPELAQDYAGQDDLAIATTLAPEMLKCFLRGQPFSSLRFSRHGERFAYLKLDCEGVGAEARLASRRELEDRLVDALSAGGLGTVVGNGLGVRYAYVDLALANLDAAVERVRAIGRDAKVSPRSWLLFCDGDLGAEWVGIWDDTPAPPFLR